MNYMSCVLTYFVFESFDAVAPQAPFRYTVVSQSWIRLVETFVDLVGDDEGARELRPGDHGRHRLQGGPRVLHASGVAGVA